MKDNCVLCVLSSHKHKLMTSLSPGGGVGSALSGPGYRQRLPAIYSKQTPRRDQRGHSWRGTGESRLQSRRSSAHCSVCIAAYSQSFPFQLVSAEALHIPTGKSISMSYAFILHQELKRSMSPDEHSLIYFAFSILLQKSLRLL